MTYKRRTQDILDANKYETHWTYEKMNIWKHEKEEEMKKEGGGKYSVTWEETVIVEK